MNQLCRPDVADVVRGSLEFHRDRGVWLPHACVLMPDHLHLLATVPPDTALAHVVSHWKRFVARRAHVRWQRDFFEHRLRRNEHFDAKLEYLRMNPVRAGLVKDAQDWPYFWTW